MIERLVIRQKLHRLSDQCSYLTKDPFTQISLNFQTAKDHWDWVVRQYRAGSSHPQHFFAGLYGCSGGLYVEENNDVFSGH